MPETYERAVNIKGEAVVKVTHTTERHLSRRDLEQEKYALLQEIDALQRRVQQINDMLRLLE